MTDGWKLTLLALIALGPLAVVLSLDPVPQSAAYHRFADQRTFLGIPNFADVASNIPFLMIGVWGLWSLGGSGRAVAGEARMAWRVAFAAIVLVSLGSGYYHWSPSNPTLLWDRLPLSVAFMGVLVAVLSERISARIERLALIPAVLVGVASVVYWWVNDDLRPYLWVQAVPILAMPAVLALFPARYTGGGYLYVALGCYLAAKLAELWDAEIFGLTGHLISGHTVKHLLSALALAVIQLMLLYRTAAPSAPIAPDAAAR